MNILFMCGSMQPGYDGVGDYTRRLAVELIKHEIKVSAISINDQHITQVIEEDQSEGGILLKVLRLPSSLSENDKLQHTKAWIANKNPNLISVQFVLFAFHPKGIPLKLSSFLKAVNTGQQWHIMFHELWVGMAERSAIMQDCWGRIQKWLIKSTVRNLKPVMLHTQTRVYQLQLQKLGLNVKYLPLFSNIPNKSNLNEKDILMPDEVIFMVMFGGIHPGAPVKEFIEEVVDYQKLCSSKLRLQIVGRSGAEHHHWEAMCNEVGLSVENVGEQTVEKVSEMLLNAAIGISTTPASLADKSGTIAAMREHRLPVLCVRDKWKPKGISEIPDIHGILEYKPGNFKYIFDVKKSTITNLTASQVALRFINDLKLFS